MIINLIINVRNYNFESEFNDILFVGIHITNILFIYQINGLFFNNMCGSYKPERRDSSIEINQETIG